MCTAPQLYKYYSYVNIVSLSRVVNMFTDIIWSCSVITGGVVKLDMTNSSHQTNTIASLLYC